jgi:branched-chain amino acid transport system substrate-binding protein
MKRIIAMSLSAISLIFASGVAWTADQYGPGASDTEIKIGNTMPYSGPASSYGVIGKSEAAYFAMINEQGGIKGRKINFINRDDGYSPPKTIEQVRKMVEEDGVLFLFQTFGTPSNTASDGLQPELSPRGPYLWPLHSQNPARRQDRSALSKR